MPLYNVVRLGIELLVGVPCLIGIIFTFASIHVWMEDKIKELDEK